MRPRLESPTSVRRFLALAALASVALLVYASLVPLNYRPLSWESTWQAWHQIPWLQLDVFHRADWVANALVVLPSGILAAAAVDWGRRSSWPLLLASPFITFFLTLVVIAIELAQVWFPPRTVSLNDIAAGFVGAALGPTLWAMGGPTVEKGIANFLSLPQFRDRLKWLCIAWFVAAVIYSVLPLDLVVSHAEWQERLASNSLRLNPFAAGIGASSTVADIAFAALRMAPIGALFWLVGDRRKSRWALWLLPIGLELMQVPLYSKYVTSVAVFGGWIGGWIGYWGVSQFHRLETLVRRPAVWGFGWILSFALACLAILAGYERVIGDPVEISERYAGAWSFPFVKYYAGSEYSAYTVMAEKMVLFGAIGACCAGWTNTTSQLAGQAVFWSSLVAVTLAAVAIELSQVYLPPLVPDLSDVIVYMAGYVIGYQILKLLWGPLSPALSGCRQPQSQFIPSE